MKYTKHIEPPRPPWRERKPAAGVLDGYLTKKQLAAQLDVTPRCVEYWIARGVGPTVTMVGRFPYFEKSDVAAWLESRKRRTPSARRVDLKPRKESRKRKTALSRGGEMVAA